MFGWVILGFLAAAGVLALLWGSVGWLLPGGSGGFVVCPYVTGDRQALAFLRRCCWLRQVGLLRCPVLVAASREDRALLRSIYKDDIVVCTSEELTEILKQERDDFG